ncbi:glutamate racemase [Rathayibacter iranicus]|uniref:Glutamate racemase n=2 Tax=Rathayibacter iranicus TaxID=59737 RepID=A0AAD1ELL7_9MICO|nr:glutamate racemase [Rathayibacter iranicus]AZZ54629.1 glutamate racemase [Rathayibacter iranicus]MWV30415.1 glutamate racemase [Rathayibacter iranicus NCPPB 2253 = VKM Ac-1602]PPI51206.1 glutamate racemase [Rathayibacter iranicus]PPI63408.1 glutamate racemase [Rathayibacter iranicus]PPI74118.1 glutamate racemase [Rathayibacter iranicus]
MTDAPLGIFDSGVGGLTVARSIIDQLQNESIVYLGDTAHSPYGPKPLADVRAYALDTLDTLVDQGAKLLVIACNTASAAMMRDARERYTLGRGIPVIEVIHPAVRSAVRDTRNRRVGVIGTVGTIRSRAYDDAFVAAPDLHLVTAACPRFVEFVEAGVTWSDELLAVAEEYLAPLKAAGVDTLVLGCTHYPLLRGAIAYVMGPDVRLVSSAEETALDVYRTLVAHGLQRTSAEPPSYRWEETGSSDFVRLARRFLGPEVSSVDLVETGTINLRELDRAALPNDRGRPE